MTSQNKGIPFYLPISLSIHYLYREFTTNQFRSSPNYNEFTIYSTNSKRRFHYLFREFTSTSLLISRIHFHYLYREFTLDSLWYFNEFIFNSLYILRTTNSLRVHYEFTTLLVKSINEFTTNLLPSSRIHFKVTVFFKNSLSIHYLDRKFTKNSRFSFFVNSLWIHFLFQNFTTNSFPVSRNQF